MQAIHIKLGEEGRIVLPASFRHPLGLKAGDTLVIESDGDSLLIRSLEQVVYEVQSTFTSYRAGESFSDESEDATAA